MLNGIHDNRWVQYKTVGCQPQFKILGWVGKLLNYTIFIHIYWIYTYIYTLPNIYPSTCMWHQQHLVVYNSTLKVNYNPIHGKLVTESELTLSTKWWWMIIMNDSLTKVLKYGLTWTRHSLPLCSHLSHLIWRRMSHLFPTSEIFPALLWSWSRVIHLLPKMEASDILKRKLWWIQKHPLSKTWLFNSV